MKKLKILKHKECIYTDTRPVLVCGNYGKIAHKNTGIWTNKTIRQAEQRPPQQRRSSRATFPSPSSQSFNHHLKLCVCASAETLACVWKQGKGAPICLG